MMGYSMRFLKKVSFIIIIIIMLLVIMIRMPNSENNEILIPNNLLEKARLSVERMTSIGR